MNNKLSNAVSDFLLRLAPVGKGLLVLLGLAFVVFGVDVGLGLYDEAVDPACKTGGILTAPWKLKQGVNQVAWKEPFRITGLQFQLQGRALKSTDVEQLQRGVGGNLFFTARPASAAEGETEEWDYAFRVETQPPVKLPSVESVDDVASPDSLRVEMGVRYDATCDVVPAQELRAVAESLHLTEFPANTPLSLTLILDEEVAGKLELRIAYAKRPRSLFPKREFVRAEADFAPRSPSRPQE